ncbi:MAG: 50S ribosomal protein L21 [Alphaproteobacteria bacterium]
MFAVIKAGGRQYRVAANDVIEIDRIPGDAGDQVAFDQVLMVVGPDGSTVGTPVVDGASVAGELVDHTRSAKVIAFKKRRRQNSRRSRGHRQHLTVVRITEILTDGKKAAPKKAAAKPRSQAPKPAKEPAAKTDTAFVRPSGEPDDLKRISGVGPVLEGKLNALGITRFDQIAAFSADDIAKVDDLLNFKGRIERDGWLEQATELAKGDSEA